MKYYLWVFLLLTFFTSCAIPKKAIKAFGKCYNNNPTRIFNQIQTNGYYEMRVDFDNPMPKPEGIKYIYKRFVFYSDGLILADGFSSYSSSLESDGCVGYYQGMNCTYLDWGLFEIQGDTLEMRYIHSKGSLNDNWRVYAEKFIIIEGGDLTPIIGSSKLIYPIDRTFNEKSTTSSSNSYDNHMRLSKARFFPCTNIPKEDSWLKRQKWIQCK